MRRGERQKREPEITLRPMTDKILKNLVTEAVSLDREINEKANQLKELKAQLVAEARGREGELARTDGGGTRWTAEGSDGSIARVNTQVEGRWGRKAHRKDQKSRRYPVRSAPHPHDRL